MRCGLFLVLACATLAYVGATAPLLNMDSEFIVPNQYIVVFNEHVTKATRDQHVSQLSAKLGEGEGIIHMYSIGTFTGYAAKLSKSNLVGELENPNVKFVEADTAVHISDTDVTQDAAEWGLARIDERDNAVGDSYTYWESAGEGVWIYVIDTGILTSHTDFGGRAFWGTNTVDNSDVDGNGHGTHCASTSGGTVYGVAKKATLIAVKVLAANGSGTNAGVIAGVEWVTANHTARLDKRSVANMSLGGGASSATDTAVAASVAAGVSYSVAAGNNGANACNYSPARTPSAVTVGATAKTDARASFSNYGDCLDIFAPGVDVVAAYIGSNTATAKLSGTSMAAPHVAGAIAVFLGHGGPATPAEVTSFLVSNSTLNKVTSPGAKSPNRLLYSPFN